MGSIKKPPFCILIQKTMRRRRSGKRGRGEGEERASVMRSITKKKAEEGGD